MVFLRAKVIVIGDCCVGKSSICQVLGSDGGMYPKVYTSTILTDLFIKQVHLTDSNDTVELFLHDNSGKALYFENCNETWLNADMICLVYDVNNKESYGHVRFWYDKVKDAFPPEKSIIGCVIGNKSDLTNLTNQANQKNLFDTLKIKTFECSAKDNTNVIEPFKYLAGEFIKKYKERTTHFSEIVDKNVL